MFSLLPLGILYLLSDFAYFIIYHVLGYRKKVVLANLLLAFPEKTEKERAAIAKKFYKNFADSFIETLKLFSASDNFIKEHFTGDFSVFDPLNEEGLRYQIHSGHFFNWEYANLSFPLHLKCRLLTVYMPITNTIFDRLFIKLRSKTGADLLPATNLSRAILPYRNEKYALALIADQSPPIPKNALWVNFFGHPTAFIKAPESGARRGNIPVVFSYFLKEKRGYYRIYFDLAHKTPAETKEGELTKAYAAYLEEAICKQPDLWLWSHRRWKHQWHPDYGPVL